MALLYTLFVKVVPIISVWELKVGFQPAHTVVPAEADESEGLWRTQP